jgi:Ca-activated chloride channel family protein
VTPDAILDAVLEASNAYGLAWREPALLWGVLLVPVVLILAGLARATRSRTRDLFRVAGTPSRPRHGRWRRAIAAFFVMVGLGGLAVAFARPVWTHPQPLDRATVVVVLDASGAMRATDVAPSRLEAARRVVRDAINAAPTRLQVAGVAYGPTAYLVAPPTHDHGAVTAALGVVRTVIGAAPGDALAVALAAIPSTGSGAAAGTEGAPARVSAAIILVATGDATVGRPVDIAAASLAEAGVPVHVVPIGPTGVVPTPAPNATPAPFVPRMLQAIARQTNGRSLDRPQARDWREVYEAIGEDVVMQDLPEEVGHLVGGIALGAWALGMTIMVWTSRRLV